MVSNDSGLWYCPRTIPGLCPPSVPLNQLWEILPFPPDDLLKHRLIQN